MRTEYWWIRTRSENGDLGDVRPASVEFEGDSPRYAYFIGTTCFLLPESIGELVLVEPVLPPGRAAVAVEKLGDTLAGYPILDCVLDDVRSALAILKGEAAAGA